MNLNKHSKVRAVGLSCFLAVTAVLGLAVFCPFDAGAETYAADITKTGNINIDFVLQKVATGNINIDFLLAPLLSISVDGLQSTTSAEYNPVSATASTVAQTAGFSVSSNSTQGYGVFVYGDNAALTSESGHTINSTATATTLSNLTAGTWGFNLKAGEYTVETLPTTELFSPMPTSKGNAAATGSVVENQKYTLTFGAKVGYETYADTYKNNVTVQVVANGQTTAALNAYNETREALLDQIDEEKAYQDSLSRESESASEDLANI